MSVQGKKVLITGSSHGIGAASALAFAENGCEVGINYNKNPEGAEETAEKIRKIGGKAEIFQADVADPAQAEGMVKDFIRKFGGIDILVNNAGGALKIPRGDFPDMPLEYWDYQIRLNLSAAAYTAHVAIGYMREHSIRGRIINVSSIHSLHFNWFFPCSRDMAPAGHLLMQAPHLIQ